MTTPNILASVELYINYNNNDAKVPKVWACNNDGDLIFGSVNKAFAYQKKTVDYLFKNSNTKRQDGYRYIGTVTLNFLTGDRWDLLKKFWYSNPLAVDVAAMKVDAGLLEIAESIVSNDPGNGNSKVRSLQNNLISVKSASSSAAMPNQAAPAATPPKAKKTKVKLTLLKNAKATTKADSSWSW